MRGSISRPLTGAPTYIPALIANLRFQGWAWERTLGSRRTSILHRLLLTVPALAVRLQT